MQKRILSSLIYTIVLLTTSVSLLYAQTRVVKGKVTDANDGTTLPGVNVIVKGSSMGTATDANGNYSITADANDVLIFSYIGYATAEFPVGNRDVVDVSLSLDVQSLNEIVVVGYGTQRKIETTGAIASVKAEEITQTPVSNVAQGLQARVSGVQVVQNSAAPGGNVSVRVRGTNSINGTSEPLYIIDGVQVSNGGGINDVSPLSTINPNDIESVEVLKDASSTAIYGARGANGVVLVTTKRGKSGATRVTYDGYYGVQQVSKTMDMMNATEFAGLENEVYKTSVYPDPSSLGEGVNWQKLIFRDAAIQNHQLSVVGGSEKTQFNLSANYFNQDGVVINSGFKRYSMRINLDHKINDRVKVGTSLLGSYSINNTIPTGQTSLDGAAVTESIVGAAMAAPPTLQPYRDDGTVYPFGDQMSGRYREVVNPLGLASILNKTSINRIMSNVYAEAKLIKGLTYRASFNVILQDNLNDHYSPIYILSKGDQNANAGSGSKANSTSSTLLHESILTYATTFAGNHSLKVTGLYSTQGIQNRSNSMSATGFPNDATLNEALQLATNRTISSLRNRERLDSYMGRVNYGFKDRYFIDLTARVDGSSKFGANHKYGFFPAVSGGWRIIEEGFMKNLPVISDMKLRASYGLTGNAGAINPYQSLATVGSGTSYIFNHAYTTGISPGGIPNPDLRWEKSYQTDIGLDLSLFGNRINIVADVYKKTTKDLLYVKTLPLSSGYASVTGNFAELENKGLELAVNARVIDKAIKWNVSGNITFNRNKIVDLDGGTTDETFVTPYTVVKVGSPLGVFKTYQFDGIYQNGETLLPGSDSRVGGSRVKDISGDGAISSDDQTITGNPNPKFIFGFTTSLKYKNFDVTAFFSGTYGNQIYNVARYIFEDPLGQRNMYGALVDRWSPTNPSNEYVSGFQGGRLPISDRFLENGSYLRCKNITFGYTLPAIPGVSKIRIYVSANNLFTVTRYTGFDPEVNSYGGSNTAIGIDNLVYPLAKSYLGGIQVTF
jgi:TonB-linked SusC/RagA family outer membrane protein